MALGDPTCGMSGHAAAAETGQKGNQDIGIRTSYLRGRVVKRQGCVQEFINKNKPTEHLCWGKKDIPASLAHSLHVPAAFEAQEQKCVHPTKGQTLLAARLIGVFEPSTFYILYTINFEGNKEE